MVWLLFRYCVVLYRVKTQMRMKRKIKLSVFFSPENVSHATHFFNSIASASQA